MTWTMTWPEARRVIGLALVWALGIAIAWLSVLDVWPSRIGQDSHAYWAAWQGDWRTEMYDIAPGQLDAFNYSPVFAQVIWPLAQLPWPVFGVLWSLAAFAAFWHLFSPLRWWWSVPLMLLCTGEILTGNVFWVLALVAAYALRPDRPARAATWCIPLLTKVTPALGPVWFALRRELRPLAVSIVATLVVVGCSYAISPGLWHQWLTFVLDHEASSTRVGAPVYPPLLYRLPAALVLLVFGAVTDRRWCVPVAMSLASPVAGLPMFTVCAAIPRLQRQHARELADRGPQAGPAPHAPGGTVHA